MVTLVMAWSTVRRFTPDDSRLITPETTPSSFPTNLATAPLTPLTLVTAAREQMNAAQRLRFFFGCANLLL